MSVAFSRYILKSGANQRFSHMPWGVGAVISLLLLIVVAQFSLSLVFYSSLNNLGFSQTWLESNTISFFVYGLTSLVSALILWLFLRRYRVGLKQLGLLESIKLRQIGLVLLGVAIYLGLSISLTVVIGSLFPGLNLEEEQATGFSQTGNVIELCLVFVSLVIVPPVIEEAVFRGFVFGGLRSRMPFFAAACLSSALFGLVHFQLNVAIDTAALGLVLAWLCEKTGSLWPAIMLHALKNFTAFALIFIFGV